MAAPDYTNLERVRPFPSLWLWTESNYAQMNRTDKDTERLKLRRWFDHIHSEGSNTFPGGAN
jgi:hypothetical protein